MIPTWKGESSKHSNTNLRMTSGPASVLFSGKAISEFGLNVPLNHHKKTGGLHHLTPWTCWCLLHLPRTKGKWTSQSSASLPSQWSPILHGKKHIRSLQSLLPLVFQAIRWCVSLDPHTRPNCCLFEEVWVKGDPLTLWHKPKVSKEDY